jgi:hypothetical protein
VPWSQLQATCLLHQAGRFIDFVNALFYSLRMLHTDSELSLPT